MTGRRASTDFSASSRENATWFEFICMADYLDRRIDEPAEEVSSTPFSVEAKKAKRRRERRWNSFSNQQRVFERIVGNNFTYLALIGIKIFYF